MMAVNRIQLAHRRLLPSACVYSLGRAKEVALPSQRNMIIDVVASEGPTLLLQARGRINILTADLFESEVRRALAGKDRDVIIDASEITYLSSAGLRAFLRLWQDLQKKDRSIHLCSLKPYIREVFELIGFDQIIPIEKDVPAALAALKSRSR